MQAGRLQTRIKILRPLTSDNAFGEALTQWREAAVVWAERAKFSFRYAVQEGQPFAAYDAEFLIRTAHEVKEGWRVQEVGGNLYHVQNIEPNRRRGLLRLKCERVND